jgi:hypothetical protein
MVYALFFYLWGIFFPLLGYNCLKVSDLGGAERLGGGSVFIGY